MTRSSEESAWVLLVDDHEDGRELLGEFLAFNGYTVEGCASGEDALELVARLGCPSVVITDLSLGVMSGSDLARRFRMERRTAAIPILAVTGHASFDDPEHLFDAVFVKPVSLSDLSAVVERALRRGSNYARP